MWRSSRKQDRKRAEVVSEALGPASDQGLALSGYFQQGRCEKSLVAAVGT